MAKIIEAIIDLMQSYSHTRTFVILGIFIATVSYLKF